MRYEEVDVVHMVVSVGISGVEGLHFAGIDVGAVRSRFQELQSTVDTGMDTVGAEVAHPIGVEGEHIDVLATAAEPGVVQLSVVAAFLYVLISQYEIRTVGSEHFVSGEVV